MPCTGCTSTGTGNRGRRRRCRRCSRSDCSGTSSGLQGRVTIRIADSECLLRRHRSCLVRSRVRSRAGRERDQAQRMSCFSYIRTCVCLNRMIVRMESASAVPSRSGSCCTAEADLGEQRQLAGPPMKPCHFQSGVLATSSRALRRRCGIPRSCDRRASRRSRAYGGGDRCGTRARRRTPAPAPKRPRRENGAAKWCRPAR